VYVFNTKQEVKPRYLVEIYQRFGGKYCLCFKGMKEIIPVRRELLFYHGDGSSRFSRQSGQFVSDYIASHPSSC
jgi:hypothetical protein